MKIVYYKVESCLQAVRVAYLGGYDVKEISAFCQFCVKAKTYFK